MYQLRSILEARALTELRDLASSAFADMGMPRLMCISPIGHDRTIGREVTNVGFPQDWEDAYQSGRRLTDPLPDIAVRISMAFKWHDLPSDVVLNQEEAAYLGDLSGWGMQKGLCVATYGPAARVGFVAASSATGEDDLNSVDRAAFQITAQTAYLRYCQLEALDLDYQMNLSSRELDVLHWMAQGRSNAGIGEALQLSPETISTYVKRIFAKLGVFDRTSAVMKGVVRGLVIASDPAVEAEALARRTSSKEA